MRTRLNDLPEKLPVRKYGMEDNNHYLYNYKPPAAKYSETSIFSIKGRITRFTYFRRFGYSLLLIIVIILLYYNQTDGKSLNDLFIGDFDLFGLYLFLSILIFIIFILIQRIKRVHDSDKPGVYALIPFWVFLKGTEGNNNYGIDPVIKEPAFFDQLKDQPSEYMNDRKITGKHKANIIIFAAIGIFTLLIFSISQTVRHEGLKSVIIPSDSIPGIYIVKRITSDTQGPEMYAEITKNNLSGFIISVLSESGRREYDFSRNESGSLFSGQLGNGKAVYSDLPELRNLVITFSSNTGTTWEFSKSR